MTQTRFWHLLFAVAFASSVSTACGDSASDDPSTQTIDSAETAGDVQAGAAAVTTRVCGSCHTGTTGLLAGQSMGTKGPNITPDEETGIGGWSQEQIVSALLTGKDDEGEQLCNVMPLYGGSSYGMTEAEALNIAAYLKSIPAIRNESVEACPD